jgi:FkbM family methyltransferase
VNASARSPLAAAVEKALVLNARGGARLCLPAVFDVITTYVLLEQEDWFEDEIRFVRRWLRPGMRAVDVGANYGLYTVTMARAVGREGRVWAFEPAPDTARFLDATLRLNDLGQAELRRAAVSNSEGKLALSLEVHPEGDRVSQTSAAPADSIEVPAVTLSRLAEAQGWGEVDFLKIDVEGHEPEAIAGAAGLLRSCSPLVMFEVNAGDRFDFRALTTLAEMGYRFYALLPQLLVLVPFDENEPVDDYLLNLFACKPDRAARLAAEGFLTQTNAASRATPSADAWPAYAAAAPYSRELAARWAAAGQGAQSRTYRRGLAAFAQAQAARAAAERCAWLRHAMDCVEEAAATSARLAWKISYARIAWELGWRRSAVGALMEATERLEAEPAEALAEPFLAPSERYEKLSMAGQASAWLTCALAEQVEKLRAYSSLLVGDTSLSLLEPILGLPFCSPEMERRCQLARIVAGRQAGPQPAPLLRTRSAENLNPEFWCGKAS